MNEVKSNKTYTTLFGDHFNNLVVFGNPDAPAEFQNHMKIGVFGNEHFISFHNEDAKGTPTLDGERLTLDISEKTYYWEPETQNKMRWVEVLKTKPASNKWTLKLSGHEDFLFKYQPKFEDIAKDVPYLSVETFQKNGEDWLRLVDSRGGPFGDLMPSSTKQREIINTRQVKFYTYTDQEPLMLLVNLFCVNLILRTAFT